MSYFLLGKHQGNNEKVSGMWFQIEGVDMPKYEAIILMLCNFITSCLLFYPANIKETTKRFMGYGFKLKERMETCQSTRQPCNEVSEGLQEVAFHFLLIYTIYYSII